MLVIMSKLGTELIYRSSESVQKAPISAGHTKCTGLLCKPNSGLNDENRDLTRRIWRISVDLVE